MNLFAFAPNDDPIVNAEVRQDTVAALESWWFRLFAGMYLTPAQRGRFRGLPLHVLAGQLDTIAWMRDRGVVPEAVHEIRRIVLSPGEPDLPVKLKGRLGDPYGPQCGPRTGTPAPTGLTLKAPPERSQGPCRASRKNVRGPAPGQLALPFDDRPSLRIVG